MSEKKLRRVLTAAALATSLLLTGAAGASAAEPYGQRTEARGKRVSINPGDSRPFLLWRLLLVSVWEKSDRGAGMDPEGARLRSWSSEGADDPTYESGSSLTSQGGR